VAVLRRLNLLRPLRLLRQEEVSAVASAEEGNLVIEAVSAVVEALAVIVLDLASGAATATEVVVAASAAAAALEEAMETEVSEVDSATAEMNTNKVASGWVPLLFHIVFS